MHQKKFDEALKLMEGLIRKTEDMHMFTDDSVSEYHCFNEFFEEALYRNNAKPERELRNATYPFDRIYALYGSLLIDLHRPDDAREALATALHWNPADADIAFEYAETSKMKGDMENFFQLTLGIFKYAFLPNHVARCFRNLGFYFSEMKQWKEATGCLTMSLQFEEDSKSAMSELYYIQQKAEETIPTPSIDLLKEYGQKYGFPVGADPDVLGLSYAYGKHFADRGNYKAAKYCWEITYGLTDDEEIKKMIESLPMEEES